MSDERVLEDGRTPHPDQIAGWQGLYAKARSGGKWRVSAPDASLVVLLGMTIALQQRRYEEAIRQADEYLSHPDAEKGDEVAWENTSVRMGLAQVLSGRIDEGIRTLNGVLARQTRSGRSLIRNDLLQVLPDMGEESTVDPRLAAFIEQLLLGWEGQEAKAGPAALASTNGELIDLLQKTYGKLPHRSG